MAYLLTPSVLTLYAELLQQLDGGIRLHLRQRRAEERPDDAVEVLVAVCNIVDCCVEIEIAPAGSPTASKMRLIIATASPKFLVPNRSIFSAKVGFFI